MLILTKPLGVGILSAALKQERLPQGGYETMIASTTQLNSVGTDLAALEGVHAITDVTGFGLLGHGLEMARGAGLTAEIDAEPPLLPGVEALARAGIRTGASGRNWESYGEAVSLPDGFPDWRKDILCDPQTSGGLLVAVAAEQTGRVLELAESRGFKAAIVGRMREGEPRIRVVG